MKRTLIRGATIVTMDQQGDLYDADILIEGSRIKEIAKHINVQADNTINGSGYIVIPGLINAHMHTWQTDGGFESDQLWNNYFGGLVS